MFSASLWLVGVRQWGNMKACLTLTLKSINKRILCINLSGTAGTFSSLSSLLGRDFFYARGVISGF